MPAKLLYTLIDSPTHPNFMPLYDELGLNEMVFETHRKAMSSLKKHQPDFVVAEFFYGWGNNYAGANLGNLDVFLSSLQRYAADAKVIVMVHKEELPYAEKLGELFPLHRIFTQPVSVDDMREALQV